MEGRFNDDPKLLDLLDIPNTPSWCAHVNSVHAAFAANLFMRNDMEFLERVSDPAESFQNREQMMYQPLLRILRWISGHSNPDPLHDFDRQWIVVGKEGPIRDVESQSEGNRKPDLVLVEKQRVPQVVLQEDHKPRWREVSVTMEIKWRASDGPTVDTVILNEAVLQTLDCMRLHIASRPFLRWTFSLLICGMDFYVLYVDRAGGAITPTQNLRANIWDFISLILHLTTISRSALGQDPDVRFEHDEPQYTLRSTDQNPLGQTHPWDAKYPIYSLPGFPGGDRIRVVGPPHFASYGLLGRGTTVWPVRIGTGPVQVLKYSWRRVGRQSESDIYRGIQAVYPKGTTGLCEFVDGGDVVWDTSFQQTKADAEALCINPRRKVLASVLERGHDRVLHRLVLDTRGFPISNFTDAPHLIQVLTSALRAHKELADKGILHRDISSGNILISSHQKSEEQEDGEDEKGNEDNKETDTARPAGLLTDVELAKILPGHDPQLQYIIPDVTTAGPDYTCTLHFTATEILVDISQRPEVTVIPGIRHDLESFFYVAVWAILIKVQKYDAALRSKDLTKDQTKKWEKAKQFRTRLIKNMFGPHDIVSVTSGRLDLTHSPFFKASVLFPIDLTPEFDAFRDLWERLLKLFGPAVQSQRDITHAEVISALEPSHAS